MSKNRYNSIGVLFALPLAFFLVARLIVPIVER